MDYMFKAYNENTKELRHLTTTTSTTKEEFVKHNYTMCKDMLNDGEKLLLCKLGRISEGVKIIGVME